MNDHQEVLIIFCAAVFIWVGVVAGFFVVGQLDNLTMLYFDVPTCVVWEYDCNLEISEVKQ